MLRSEIGRDYTWMLGLKYYVPFHTLINCSADGQFRKEMCSLACRSESNGESSERARLPRGKYQTCHRGRTCALELERPPYALQTRRLYRGGCLHDTMASDGQPMHMLHPHQTNLVPIQRLSHSVNFFFLLKQTVSFHWATDRLN